MSEDTNPLHDLMRNARADFGGGLDQAWLDQVRAALDGGALPNEQDEHDMSPLAILVDSGIGNSTAYTAGVELMIERGANPLINDRAFGRAVQGAAIGPDGGLAGAMLAAMIRMEEAGRPVRSETGETALHVMCADAPEGVWAFVADGGGSRGGMGEKRIPAHWYTAIDDNGATALHAMWRDGSVIYDRLGAEMDVDNEVGAWEAMAAMVENGADLLARDGQRVTVANRVLACVEMGMPTDEAEIWPQVEALATCGRLEEHTAKVKPRGGQAPRL